MENVSGAMPEGAEGASVPGAASPGKEKGGSAVVQAGVHVAACVLVASVVLENVHQGWAL